MTTTLIETAARQDYLKAIYHLGRGSRRVLTTELADSLGVRKPSVSAMLKRLAEEGLVHYSPRQGATLSAAGRAASLRVVRRHRLLETFLVRILGLDWSEVHVEAEVLEHHLSDRIVDAIDRALGYPREDPHGHPIPDADGGIHVRDVVPLREMTPGGRAFVREVRASGPGRLTRWKQMGLVPGAEVVMRARQAFEDVMHLVIDGREVVTGSEGVDGIFVENAS